MSDSSRTSVDSETKKLKELKLFKEVIISLIILISATMSGNSSASSADFQTGLNAFERQDYDTALKVWTPLATEGFADAQLMLGVMYLSGAGLPINYTKAMRWLQPTADKGHPYAQAFLGSIYDRALGVPPDRDLAYRLYSLAVEKGDAEVLYIVATKMTWPYKMGLTPVKLFTLAANQGHAESQYRLAEHHMSQFEFEAAYNWLLKATEQGLADAQVRMGDLYDNGFHVPEDRELALKWYMLAADQGLANAQRRLGRKYAEGKGVAQSSEKSLIWFTLAAEQNDAEAIFELGRRHKDGEGIPQDNIQAHKWFLIYSELQDNASWSRIDNTPNMSVEEIEKARNQAVDWLNKHQ